MIIIRMFTQVLMFLLLVVSAYAIYLAVASREDSIQNDPSFNIYSVVEDGWEGLWFVIQSFQVSTCMHVYHNL